MDKPMTVLDCFGEMCPIPVLRVEKQLKETPPGGEFMLVTDHSCIPESIKAKYGGTSVSVRVEEVMNGVWEIYFKKG